MSEERRSDINGVGYGSAHSWRHGHTSPAKYTTYTCCSCGAKFRHHYDRTSNIFDAMKNAKVPEHCTVTKEEVR